MQFAVLNGENKGKTMPFSIGTASVDRVANKGNKTPTHQIDLKASLNGHLTKTIKATINGKEVFVSGTFDKAQNAFLTVKQGAGDAKLFDIRGLLDAEGKVTIGGQGFSIFLEANALRPLRSRINFVNDADEDDEYPIRLGKLLDKVMEAGKPIQFSDQAYRFYYMDGVKKGASGPVMDPAARTVGMILKEGEEMHVFLIPESDIPKDQIAVFKMHEDKRVGMRRNGDKLEIYENP